MYRNKRTIRAMSTQKWNLVKTSRCQKRQVEKSATKQKTIWRKPPDGPYRTCPYCGANLDPGEQCDCKEKSAPGVTTSESGKYDADTQSHI